jgi:hypothetical protein
MSAEFGGVRRLFCSIMDMVVIPGVDSRVALVVINDSR